jgi:hypothetical protein
MIRSLIAALALLASILIMAVVDIFSWNIPGHMLSGAIAYQVLRQESPTTMPAIRLALEKNP